MLSQQVPEAFSKVFGLGGVQTLYPVKKAGRWASILFMIVFGLAAVIAALYAVWNAYDSWQHYGPAIVFRSFIGPFVLAILAGSLALMLAWSAYNNWSKMVVVYQNGLAYRDRKGVRSWRWDEFGSVTAAVTKHYTNGVYTGTTHIYTLQKQDGEKIIVNDSITNVEALATEIRAQIYPLLYKRYADSYNAGQNCVFGPVRIGKTMGVQIKNKSYPWDQVAEVSIQRGVLSVKKKDGGWFSGATAPASTIPNLEVLLAIIAQVVGVRTGQ